VSIIAEIPEEYPDIIQEFEQLQSELNRVIPPKVQESNLLIATWNIKMFGDLKKIWEDTEARPKRNLRALKFITEIISRFDVIAIQETMGNLRALRYMLKELGSNWGLLMTDEVRGDRGNHERLAFIFDSRRVNLSGLAGELVIPDAEMGRYGIEEPEFTIEQQFARTPYAVGFKSGGRTFVLITLHVLFGKKDEEKKKERGDELLAISKWLSDWANEINIWEHNLIALGDFNIDRKEDVLYDAFTSGGLEIHQHFHDLPRTIRDKGKKPSDRNFYDQIAWFTGEDGKPALSLKYLKGGYFDFTACVYIGMSNSKLEWRMSDHFPLWAEFELEPVEEEEVIPTVPTHITDAMEEEKAKNEATRKRVAVLLTDLEIASITIIDELIERGLEMSPDAERYLVDLLFRDVIVKEYYSELVKSDDISKTLSENVLALSKKLGDTVENDNRKSVTLEDLKTGIREFDKWPFEKERVGN